MQKHKFQYVIIGGGSAAFAAAIKASGLGIKTALINDGPLGGTCVNVGCVPSKYLLKAGKLASLSSRFPGIRMPDPEVVFSQVVAGKRKLVELLRQEKYTDVLASLEHVMHFPGKARFVSPHEVQVGEDVFVGEKFLIANGSSTFIPPIEGLDQVRYLTNKEALELDEVPEKLLVVGAGPLGLEFAQMYRHFGSKVVVLESAPTLLARMEPEAGEVIGKVFVEEGITVYTNAKLQRLFVEVGRKIAKVLVGKESKRIEFSEILIATGRKPNTADLGLEKTGVSVDAKGGIVVNELLQTSASHIYAGGDVVGGAMFLETTAAKMGSIATENAWKDAKRTMDWNAVPQVIFTNPEIATVGSTEAESVKNLGVCACRTVPMSLVPKARILGDTRGFIKMAINPKTKEVIGVHIVAPSAGDLIHEGTLAMKHGLTIDDIIDTVHVFPTLSEATKLVAQSFYQDVSKLSCCTE